MLDGPRSEGKAVRRQDVLAVAQSTARGRVVPTGAGARGQGPAALSGLWTDDVRWPARHDHRHSESRSPVSVGPYGPCPAEQEDEAA